MFLRSIRQSKPLGISNVIVTACPNSLPMPVTGINRAAWHRVTAGADHDHDLRDVGMMVVAGRPGRAPGGDQTTGGGFRLSCAPMGTGCAGWIGPTRACRNSRPWCGCARTTCGPAPRPAGSSVPCWRRTGLDPRPCATGWRHRSRSPSWPPPRPLRPPLASARPQGQPAADGTATVVASHRQSCRPGCARPHRPGRHPAGHPGHPCPRPGPAATHPAGDHRRARGGDCTRVAGHPRAQLLASLPGVGIINLAQLLAEVGPILDRVGSAEHAAAECGAAPVTKASGKTSRVYSRWAANRRARKALTAFAQLTVGISLGWALVRRGPRPRQAPSPRHPHRRPDLAPGHLGLLAASHPLQPRPAHRRASSCSSPNSTQGPEALCGPGGLRRAPKTSPTRVIRRRRARIGRAGWGGRRPGAGSLGRRGRPSARRPCRSGTGRCGPGGRRRAGRWGPGP
jgi:hypothetical protein